MEGDDEKKTEKERGSDVSWGENYYVRVYYVPLFDGRSGHGFLTEIRMYMYSDRQKWYKNRRERQKTQKRRGKRTKREREREKAQTRIDLDDEILNGGRREEGKRKRHDKNKKCV